MKKKKEKEPVEILVPTGKITNVSFTIPTSFEYENVKVEYSGLKDEDEVVEKYNELVNKFRPSAKPVEPMRPYTVTPVQPSEKEEILKDNEDRMKAQKQDIVELLKVRVGFVCKGKTKKEISDKVFDATGYLLDEENYEKIIDALKEYGKN